MWVDLGRVVSSQLGTGHLSGLTETGNRVSPRAEFGLVDSGQVDFGAGRGFGSGRFSGQVDFGTGRLWYRLFLEQVSFGPGWFWVRLVLGQVGFGTCYKVSLSVVLQF